MKLYNSLTREIETLIPLYSDHLGIYTCGPTVYDKAHVGHWFTYVRADILIRTLQASGLNPTWVVNITDVGHLTSDADSGEDKLQKGAQKEGKTAWEVAAFYTEDFISGWQTLNITTPSQLVKATDHIAEQVELIETLEQKGFTYQIADGVYFDTSRFPGYSAFARLDIENQQDGARVTKNPEKRNPSDFAVWKLSPKELKRDMEWPSPWGVGFPGWHIECSAMSMKYLGSTLDIHSGGIDHIPVHHTNEIAQSEAATGKRFANYWMHSNHVTINGEKISKSLGNGITLQEVTNAGISLEALRLHILESHYRSQSKFSWESLTAAQNRLIDLQGLAVLRYQAQATINDASTFALEDVPLEIQRFLEEDLNTPQALAYLSDISTQLQTVLLEDDMVDHFEAMLRGIDALLGLRLTSISDIDATTRALLSERELARETKDFESADRLRVQLASQGITVRDTPNGVIWSWTKAQ